MKTRCTDVFLGNQEFIDIFIFFNSLLTSMCHLLINFANSLDLDQAPQTSGLIWTQTVLHSDGIPEFFEKVAFEKFQ